MNILLTGSTGFIGKNIVEYFTSDPFYIYKRGESLLPYYEKDIDMVIHCAAEIYDESRMISSNVVLTQELLEFCRIKKCKFLYLGSSSEYGVLDNVKRKFSL